MYRTFKRKSFVFGTCTPKHFGPGMVTNNSTSTLGGEFGFVWKTISLVFHVARDYNI